MNPAGKKFVSLFLIFSLIMLSVNLYAKERRGAKLIITKRDGQQIEGELIAVKPTSLLLLNTEGKDVSVGIGEIEKIEIVKKSKAGSGAGAGLSILVRIGVLSGFIFPWSPVEDGNWGPIVHGIIGGVGGLLIGGVIGALARKDETIQIEGMIDSEIQETLDKLRKKARIRDYK